MTTPTAPSPSPSRCRRSARRTSVRRRRLRRRLRLRRGRRDDVRLDPLECGLDPDLAAAARRRRASTRSRSRTSRTWRSRRTSTRAWTSPPSATVPEDAVATGDFTAREAGVVAGLRVAEAVLSVVCTDEFEVERHVEDGDRVAAGQKLLTVTHPHPRPADRRAQRAQPAVPPVRHRDRHPRLGRRRSRAPAPGPRHPQDHAGPARAGEVRGALRRRRQPPDVAVGRGAGQGQPRGRGRRRRRGLQGRPRRRSRTCRSRSRSTPCTRSREVLDAGADLILLDNFTPAETAEAVALVGGPGAPGGLRAGSPWTTAARVRRDRRRLPRGRRAHPLLPDPRHRPRPASGSVEAAMLLTIDVGNTHTVLGLFDGEEIVEHWRISTDAAPHRRRAGRAAPGPDGHAPAARRPRRRHRRHRDLLDGAVGAARAARGDPPLLRRRPRDPGRAGHQDRACRS